MASNNHSNNDPRYGSLLSGSTWRPSSGPYDTPPAVGGDASVGGRQQQHSQPWQQRQRHRILHRTVGASGIVSKEDHFVGPTPPSSFAASSSDPTPNSLTDPIAQRVRFSRAEYKAPVSLQNSLDDGGVGNGISVESFYGRTPNSLDNNNMGGGGGGTVSAFRESKSYVGRYLDVREDTSNGGKRARSLYTRNRGGRSTDDDDDVGGAGSPVGGRDAFARRDMVVDFELNKNEDGAGGGGDCESERTPLERWASRRERKMRGRGGVATTSESSQDNDARLVGHGAPSPPPARETLDRTPAARGTSVKNGRMTRWSPVEDEDEKDGYEEYDGYRRADRGSDRRALDECDDSGDSRRERSRPDPLGHHQSSLAVEADEDNYTLESCESARKYGSPPLNEGNQANVDAKESSTGNKNGGRSTYADDLKSFTESVTGAVMASRNEGSHNINVVRHPTVGSRSYNGRQYDEMESSGGNPGDFPEIGVPIFHNHTRIAPESLHDKHNERESRLRPRAKDFCKRLAVCEGLHFSASGKTDKKYIWMSLSLCVACFIALSLTIHHLGKQANKDQEGRDSSWSVVETTETPSMSSIPTVQPTGAPNSRKPTLRPTGERERLISEYVTSLSGGDSNEVGSPQYFAKMWILYEDELNLHLPVISSSNQQGSDQSIGDWDSEMAQRIKQRFALATLYYSLRIGDSDLVKGWLEGEECRYVGDYGRAWDGVGCDDDGHVRAVALDGANLHGTIPSEISLLTSIENLIIKNNPGLTGTIPHSIGILNQMRQLGLNGNALTGTIPISTLRLSNLVYLNLGDNSLTGTIQWEEASHYLEKLERLILHNNQLEGDIDFRNLARSPNLSLLGLSNNLFDGNIDETVGNLRSLEFLYLDGNKLEGSIPDSIGNLINLKSLNLDENVLSGTLPKTIGNLTSLLYFSAKTNAITGELPVSMKLMTKLKTLNLASNAMTGHLQHLPHMTSLKSIHLYQNSFTGSLDAQMFVTLPKLEILFLSSNSLTGGIPSELGGPHKILKGLYLSENNLKGGIPEELCELYKLEDLFIDSNNLEGTLPSCLASLTGLKRLYAFNNKFSGQVPDRLMNLPHLIEVGIEDNNLQGGIDRKTCEAVNAAKVSIWADCTEFDGGCDCCERCCSDQSSVC